MKCEKMNVKKLLTDAAFLFLVGSLIGWLYEVGLHLVKDGVFVNRGMLHGPWVPIYGLGCISSGSLFCDKRGRLRRDGIRKLVAF